MHSVCKESQSTVSVNRVLAHKRPGTIMARGPFPPPRQRITNNREHAVGHLEVPVENRKALSTAIHADNSKKLRDLYLRRLSVSSLILSKGGLFDSCLFVLSLE